MLDARFLSKTTVFDFVAELFLPIRDMISKLSFLKICIKAVPFHLHNSRYYVIKQQDFSYILI